MVGDKERFKDTDNTIQTRLLESGTLFCSSGKTKGNGILGMWSREKKKYKGVPGDFALEMQKRALKNKEPLKIAIDCNVKACSMLQI